MVSIMVKFHRSFSTSMSQSSFSKFKHYNKNLGLEMNYSLRLSENDPQNKPLIFLFAWAGATYKNIEKYANIYHDIMDCNSLSYILPTHYIYFRNDQTPEIASSLLQVIKNHNLHQNKTLFHNFSDTGLMCYQGIHKCLTENKDYNLDIRGCVYDSCPGPIAEITLIRSFVLLYVLTYCCRRDNYTKLQTLTALERCLRERILAVPIGLLKGTTKSRVPPGLKFVDAMWAGDFVRNQKDLPSNWPEHIIYSKKDWYVSYKYLDQVIKEHLESGRDVSTLLLENSNHVGHLKMYEEKYRESVHEFTRKCLAEYF